jgi:hypothetical protein
LGGDEAAGKRLSLLGSLHLSLRRLPQRRLREVAWLGVLPEDVELAPAVAATLWGCDERSARTTLRLLRDKALLMPGPSTPDGMLTFRVHDLLHDLACRLLTAPQEPGLSGNLPGEGRALAEAHASFLDRYRPQLHGGQWHTLPDDGYIHARLTWHLERAGLQEEIHALLREETVEGRNGWYEARQRLGQAAGYLEDVARAWRCAEAMDDDGRGPWPVGLQCHYALVVTSLKSLAANVPDRLLAALVQHGVLSPEQGLTYARQRPWLPARVDALLALAPVLVAEQREPALREALDAARTIGDMFSRSKKLTEVAQHLGAEQREAVLREAMEVARDIGKPDHGLWAIKQVLPQWLAETWRQKPRVVLEVIGDLDQDIRTKLLATLLARLEDEQWEQECDLRLMSSVEDVGGIPKVGKSLIIVAEVKNVLHFRIFDRDGQMVVDTEETKLPTQFEPIEDLRQELESVWPPHELIESEKAWVIGVNYFSRLTTIIFPGPIGRS